MYRFTPSITPLEDRHCPAGTAVIVGHALYITTDTRSDAVLIQDDGLGHVRATVRGADGVEYAQGAGIDAFFVHLRGGYDQLDFALTGPAAHPLALVVDAGWGGGDERIRVELPPVTGPGQVTLDFRGNAGQGGVDAWGGPDGLSGVNVLNRMVEGTVKVHLPPADHAGVTKSPATSPMPHHG